MLGVVVLCKCVLCCVENGGLCGKSSMVGCVSRWSVG